MASILSHDSFASVREVVGRVTTQRPLPPRVVVVDNASSDGTLDWLLEQHGIEVCALDENRGVGAGHNVGIERALADPACDFVWLLEHDSLPAAECLDEMVSAARRLHAEGRDVGALMPFRMSDPDDPTAQLPADMQPHGRTNLTFNGALIPRSTFERCGRLRTDYFVGLEDSEFADRIRRTGSEILVVPKAVLVHPNKGAKRQKRLPSPVRSYYSTRNSVHLEVRLRRRRRSVPIFIGRAILGSVRSLLREDHRLQRVAGARWTATFDGLADRMGPRTYWFMNLDR